jgi:hypothetical protein
MTAFWNKLLIAGFVVGSLGVVAGNVPFSLGQEAKAPKLEKKAKGRLPPYFADIVTEKQREAIYAVQSKYLSQREELETQLAVLRDSEMDEIEQLLDEEQKTALKKARAEATAKRKKKKSDEPAAAETGKAAKAA